MQSNKLDRWLTLGTNISVLIGIILLIVEINQNRAPVWAKLFTADELSVRQDFKDEINRINAEQD